MGGNNRDKKVAPQYCQTIIHFRGLPKHLREWWITNASLQALAETIRQYRLQFAPDGEQHVLQGIQRKLKSADGCLPYPPISKERFLFTPLGVMKQVSRAFWYVKETSSDETPGVEFIVWEPATPRPTAENLLDQPSHPSTKAQFEMF